MVGEHGGDAAGGVGFAAARERLPALRLDLWAEQWRRRHAHGDVVIVRFADDYIVGFEHRDDAQRFLAELREQAREVRLELHPEKTRLIEFGRYAARESPGAWLGRPETFEFLGFTHICAKNRNGRFMLKRITISKRMAAKLREVKAESGVVGICRSPSRATGSRAWCEDTSPTTPCPATSRRSTLSGPRRPGTGIGRFGAAASATA